jgi:hypothetical protein
MPATWGPQYPKKLHCPQRYLGVTIKSKNASCSYHTAATVSACHVSAPQRPLSFVTFLWWSFTGSLIRSPSMTARVENEAGFRCSLALPVRMKQLTPNVPCARVCWRQTACIQFGGISGRSKSTHMDTGDTRSDDRRLD